MTHRPYIQITLSPRPLGLEKGEEGRNVTCQYTLIKRRRGKGGSVSEESDVEEGDVQGGLRVAEATADMGMGMGIDLDDEEDLGIAVDRRTLAPASAPIAAKTVKQAVEDGQKRKLVLERDSGAKRSKNGSSGAKGQKERSGRRASQGQMQESNDDML